MTDFNDEREFLAEVNRDQRRDDVQEFMQVYNLAADGEIELASVRVFWRGYFAAGEAFMAECKVRRPQWKRPRRLRASATSRAGALEALAGVVAQFFNPIPSSVNGGTA